MRIPWRLRSTTGVTRLLMLLMFLSSAFSQMEDCFYCGLGSAIWSKVITTGEGLFDATVIGIEAAKGLFATPPPLPPTQDFIENPPKTDPLPPAFPDMAPIPFEDKASPDTIELLVEGTPEPASPRAPAGSGDKDCDPMNSPGKHKPNSCGVPKPHIVWPLKCGDTAADAVIIKELKRYAPADQILSSINECGTFFWAAALTPWQAAKIEVLAAVEAVEPDNPGELSGIPMTYKEGLIEKRREGLAVELNAPADLAFISTPPKRAVAVPGNTLIDYAYFINAGQGITTYTIDSGAVPTNSEFTQFKIIQRWLYAIGVSRRESDDHGGYHGTCMASKIGGARLGVARKVGLVIVKIDVFRSSSFIDALVQVLHDLKSRERNNEERVRGRTVISAAVSFPVPKLTAAKVRVLIRLLVRKYQAVIVVGAGNVDLNNYLDYQIASFPALLSLELPIITVGAVDNDGGTSWYSREGAARTVSAPGNAECAFADDENSRAVLGTSTSTALVSGLAADFMSRQYLRDYLGLDRDEGSIPERVRDYIVSKAWVREGGTDNAIWNGLDPSSPIANP